MTSVGRQLAVFAAAIGAMSCQYLGAGTAAKLGGRETPAVPVLAAGADEVTLNRQWAERVFSVMPEPFSFTYGGRPSSELLPGWKVERSSREPTMMPLTFASTRAFRTSRRAMSNSPGVKSSNTTS